MSRYAKAHENPQGAGDARPTALQIVEDEGLTGKLTDKVFFVTGVSSGIGIETLRALYATGAHVFGTVRDLEKGRKVVEEIEANTTGGKITLIVMKLDSLASIKQGADDFLRQSNTLNVLISNAGVMATPEGKTKDGFETQFGINFLSHFYLFQLLKDTLLRSSSADFPSRVVSVTSHSHRNGTIGFDGHNFEKAGSYDRSKAYGQSKTAQIWFSNELERRYGSRGVHATSVHPGGIKTNLTQHIPPKMLEMLSAKPEIMAYFKNPQQGAATTIYAALSEEWASKGGEYLANCIPQEIHVPKDPILDMTSDGYAEHAYNEEGEKQLWKDALEMVALEDDQ